MWLPSSGICLLVPNPLGWGFADIVCPMLQVSGSFFLVQWIVQLDLLPQWKGALLVSTSTEGASINYLADTSGLGYLQNWSALGNWQKQQWSGRKFPHSKYWSSKLIFLIAQKSQMIITPLGCDVLHHMKLWISHTDVVRWDFCSKIPQSMRRFCLQDAEKQRHWALWQQSPVLLYHLYPDLLGSQAAMPNSLWALCLHWMDFKLL